MSQTQALFAKQPIFDHQLKVAAYELLFRGGVTSSNQAAIFDGDQATSHVLLYAFGQHRISDLIGDTPAFINFTRNMLVFPPPLPPEQLVIEVLEDVKPDEHVLASLKKLKEQGYKIALDDFFLTRETKKFVAYADIIKIDVLALSEAKLQAYVRYLKPLKIQLLAEKIETYEMLELCKQLGFELFQGYFLSKPHVIEGIKVEESKESLLRLLATLTQNDVDIKTVAAAIASDPRLSYRILKIVNSTAVNTQKEIHSLTQAASILGINQIRSWAMLLILSSNDSKPLELCVLAMTRAKFGERIGSLIGGKALGETCFTTGVLSTFDAFLDLPMDQLLQKLTLSKELQEGLTTSQGVVSTVLNLTKAYEQADWNKVERALSSAPMQKLDEPQLIEFYADAVSWARRTVFDL